MTQPTPDAITIEMRLLCELAIECWRLGRAASAAGDAGRWLGLARIARNLAGTLEALGIAIVDSSGRRYPAGFVAQVVDVRDDPSLQQGEALIDETIVPTLLWRGQVVEPGQVVIKRGPEPASELTEG